jgi:hypothetical protein
MYVGIKQTSYFSIQAWDFKNKNIQLFRQNLLPADAKEFNIDEFELVDFTVYLLDSFRVIRQTVLKDSPYTTPQGWVRYKR